MPIFEFGFGYAYARRTDLTSPAVPTPLAFFAAQDFTLDMDGALKELMGQFQLPLDVARGPLKVTGKIKNARIAANMFNDLFLNQTLTPAAGTQAAFNEAHNGGATVTVTHSATFIHDYGVFYAAPTGTPTQLTRVAPASEATGKYSVNEATGVYTFGGTDVSGAPALLFNYEYTITTATQITLANQLMGASPVLEFFYQAAYLNNGGLNNNRSVRLNAIKCSKMSIPIKNGDYMIPEFDFTAFADQSNNWGQMTFAE